ncbi:lipopolysaccharide biosynthesis protein [Pseudoclavibacter helvolus]|uniref:PST family polysaccharide transporter n=1 Tax=Pseudoclavibacter helvolus TaxID=255205 RepID=A0A7W4YGZ4_9MICO|nr:lipopolysaccharide biosynthesis protein [Pseudoclavibacter helvolus]MBB2958445.1 PST family polysaccharide transporter [Pseudoclavibacter helvolus]
MSGAVAVKWNAYGLIGRQVILLVASVLLARIIGPTSYGIVAQAAVYITFTSLLLDQGLSSALISKRDLQPRTIGAVAMLNIVMGLVLCGLTLLLSAQLAGALRTPELAPVLVALACFLPIKAGAIVPRLLLMRDMKFKPLAVAEIVSAFVGSMAAIGFALGGFSFWAVVLQYIVTDILLTIMLTISARPPLPNFRFNHLGAVAGFGLRVFGGNFLSFLARNVDTIMVSREFGATSAGYYGFAYKILMTPLQMVGQAVTRVLFPAIAKSRHDIKRVRGLVSDSTSMIALVSFPGMALVAISAPSWILGVMGAEWLPAVAIVQVLAVTGARQAVTTLNAPILLGMDRSDLHLVFNIIASVVQVAGILAGLAWGPLGVAVGYTAAGFLLMPLVYSVQRRAAGITAWAQIKAVLPALHGTAWASAVAILIGILLEGQFWLIVLSAQAVAGAFVFAVVMWFVHKSTLQRAITLASSMRGKRSK